LVALLSCLPLRYSIFDPNFSSLVMEEWMLFKSHFNKSYHVPQEEKARFEIFKSNYNLATHRTLQSKNVTRHGITKFSDLTQQEFRDLYLMKNITLNKPDPIAKPKDKRPWKLKSFKTGIRVPDSFDWSSYGAVTDVKNQGQCGSCWTFSAAETVESVCKIAGYDLTTLSEQQIVDCDSSDDGCSGGYMKNCWEYVVSAGGLETEYTYPYEAEQGTCQFESSSIQCAVSNWEWVTYDSDEDEMLSFLYENSPMSICADASTWSTYDGGVVTSNSGCGDSIDHCIQITGYQSMSGYDVWNVRNSWGDDWGNDGYIYIQRNNDVCGVASTVSVPCMSSYSGLSTVC